MSNPFNFPQPKPFEGWFWCGLTIFIIAALAIFLFCSVKVYP